MTGIQQSSGGGLQLTCVWMLRRSAALFVSAMFVSGLVAFSTWAFRAGAQEICPDPVSFMEQAQLYEAACGSHTPLPASQLSDVEREFEGVWRVEVASDDGTTSYFAALSKGLGDVGYRDPNGPWTLIGQFRTYPVAPQDVSASGLTTAFYDGSDAEPMRVQSMGQSGMLGGQWSYKGRTFRVTWQKTAPPRVTSVTFDSNWSRHDGTHVSESVTMGEAEGGFEFWGPMGCGGARGNCHRVYLTVYGDNLAGPRAIWLDPLSHLELIETRFVNVRDETSTTGFAMKGAVANQADTKAISFQFAVRDGITAGAYTLWFGDIPIPFEIRLPNDGAADIAAQTAETLEFTGEHTLEIQNLGPLPSTILKLTLDVMDQSVGVQPQMEVCREATATCLRCEVDAVPGNAGDIGGICDAAPLAVGEKTALNLSFPDEIDQTGCVSDTAQRWRATIASDVADLNPQNNTVEFETYLMPPSQVAFVDAGTKAEIDTIYPGQRFQVIASLAVPLCPNDAPIGPFFADLLADPSDEFAGEASRERIEQVELAINPDGQGDLTVLYSQVLSLDRLLGGTDGWGNAEFTTGKSFAQVDSLTDRLSAQFGSAEASARIVVPDQPVSVSLSGWENSEQRDADSRISAEELVSLSAELEPDHPLHGTTFVEGFIVFLTEEIDVADIPADWNEWLDLDIEGLAQPVTLHASGDNSFESSPMFVPQTPDGIEYRWAVGAFPQGAPASPNAHLVEIIGISGPYLVRNIDDGGGDVLAADDALYWGDDVTVLASLPDAEQTGQSTAITLVRKADGEDVFGADETLELTLPLLPLSGADAPRQPRDLGGMTHYVRLGPVSAAENPGGNLVNVRPGSTISASIESGESTPPVVVESGLRLVSLRFVKAPKSILAVVNLAEAQSSVDTSGPPHDLLVLATVFSEGGVDGANEGHEVFDLPTFQGSLTAFRDGVRIGTPLKLAFRTTAACSDLDEDCQRGFHYYASQPLHLTEGELGAAMRTGDEVEAEIPEALGLGAATVSLTVVDPPIRISTLDIRAVKSGIPVEGDTVEIDGALQALLTFSSPPVADEISFALEVRRGDALVGEYAAKARGVAPSSTDFVSDPIPLGANSPLGFIIAGDRITARYTAPDEGRTTRIDSLSVTGRPGVVQTVEFLDELGQPVVEQRLNSSVRVRVTYEALDPENSPQDIQLVSGPSPVSPAVIVQSSTKLASELAPQAPRFKLSPIANGGRPTFETEPILLSLTDNPELQVQPGFRIDAALGERSASLRVTEPVLGDGKGRLEVRARNYQGHELDYLVQVFSMSVSRGTNAPDIFANSSVDLDPGEYVVRIDYPRPFTQTIDIESGQELCLEVPWRQLGAFRYTRISPRGDREAVPYEASILSNSPAADSWCGAPAKRPGNWQVGAWLDHLNAETGVRPIDLPIGRYDIIAQVPAAQGGGRNTRRSLMIAAGQLEDWSLQTGVLRHGVIGADGRPLQNAWLEIAGSDGYTRPRLLEGTSSELAPGSYDLKWSTPNFSARKPVRVVAGQAREAGLQTGEVNIAPLPGNLPPIRVRFTALQGPDIQLPSQDVQTRSTFLKVNSGQSVELPPGSYDYVFETDVGRHSISRSVVVRAGGSVSIPAPSISRLNISHVGERLERFSISGGPSGASHGTSFLIYPGEAKAFWLQSGEYEIRRLDHEGSWTQSDADIWRVRLRPGVERTLKTN